MTSQVLQPKLVSTRLSVSVDAVTMDTCRHYDSSVVIYNHNFKIGCYYRAKRNTKSARPSVNNETKRMRKGQGLRDLNFHSCILQDTLVPCNYLQNEFKCIVSSEFICLLSTHYNLSLGINSLDVTLVM